VNDERGSQQEGEVAGERSQLLFGEVFISSIYVCEWILTIDLLVPNQRVNPINALFGVANPPKPYFHSPTCTYFVLN
jgi:hypothetical protein